MRLANVLVLLLPTLIAAQGADMFNMMSSPGILLLRPDIRKELKLNKDQSKQIDDLNKAMMQKMKEGQKDPNKMMGLFKEMDQTGLEMVAVLDESQKQRFREIHIQARGTSALLDEDVKAALTLNDDQIARINTARTAAMDEYLAGARRGKLDDKAKDKIAKEYEAAALAVLSTDQAATFKTIQGKPFPNARSKMSPPF